MKRKEEAEQLLDQILVQAQLADDKHKKKMMKEGKASEAAGESWMVFHLKLLKEIIKE